MYGESHTPHPAPPNADILHHCSTVSKAGNWQWNNPHILLRFHQLYMELLCVRSSVQFPRVTLHSHHHNQYFVTLRPV